MTVINSLRGKFFKALSVLLLASIILLSPVQFLEGEAAQEDQCVMDFQPVSKPLTELGKERYRRMDGTPTIFTGGLYPDGKNHPPAEHETAGINIGQSLQPLNSYGIPDPTAGAIVVVSIGMSNTAQEFGQFQSLVHRDPQVNPQVKLINGAVGGRTAEYWVDPSNDAWQELQRRLEHDSISNNQVQVVWIKLTLVQGGDFPEKAIELQTDLGHIVRLLKERFPNLAMAYLSSRTRSYTYWRGLSPEPVAFETGFAVKWLIEEQIMGNASLNFNPELGDVKAPILLWGPYLWVDGEIPRDDGLVWLPADLTRDCTHPSSSGKEKVAQLLFDFFLQDSTAAWFRNGYTAQGAPNSPPAAFAATPTRSPLPVASQTVQFEPARIQATPSTTATSSEGTLPMQDDENAAQGQPSEVLLWLTPVVLLAIVFLLQRKVRP